MRSIEPTLTTELTQHVGDSSVDRSLPYEIDTYRALVEQVAKLSFLNKDHLLFFRGQGVDYVSKGGGSTFYP